MFLWVLTFTYVMEVQIPCKNPGETYCVLRTEEDRQERFENKKEAMDFMRSCPDAAYTGEGCKNWKLEMIKRKPQRSTNYIPCGHSASLCGVGEDQK